MKPQQSPSHQFAYSIEAAAKAIGVGRTFIYALIKAKVIRPLRLGHRTLVAASELEALVARPQQEIDDLLLKASKKGGVE